MSKHIVSDETEDEYISEYTEDQELGEDDVESDNKIDKKPLMKTKKLQITEALKTVEERSLYIEVDRFFKKKCSYDKVQKMVDIINNDDPISLRLVNWFAMKYSTKMKTLDFIDENDEVKLFDVKISYHARLDTHSKKYFDPFRRGAKFDYKYDQKDESKVVETALCQLNFFRWLFMHDLMKYIDENLDFLKSQMGTYNVLEKKKKEKKKKEKEIIQKEIKTKKKENLNIKVKRTETNGISTIVLRM